MERALRNKGRINRSVNLPVDRLHCDKSIPTSFLSKVAAIIGPLPDEFIEPSGWNPPGFAITNDILYRGGNHRITRATIVTTTVPDTTDMFSLSFCLSFAKINKKNPIRRTIIAVCIYCLTRPRARANYPELFRGYNCSGESERLSRSFSTPITPERLIRSECMEALLAETIDFWFPPTGFRISSRRAAAGGLPLTGTDKIRVFSQRKNSHEITNSIQKLTWQSDD